MRYSSVLSAAALLVAVSAAPVHKHKRDLVTVDDCVTEVTYLTVTENLPYPSPTPTAAPEVLYHVYTTVYAITPTPEPSPVEVYTVAPPPVYAAAPSPTPEVVAAPAPVASTGNDVADIIVNAHNKYRAMHGAGPLTWAADLADFGYANSASCQMEHTQALPYGENLAMGADPAGAVDMWYNEVSSYDFTNPGFSMGTGHFTQLVWISTTEIGCGYRPDCAGGAYLKCEYRTPGNYDGEYTTNVLPAQ